MMRKEAMANLLEYLDWRGDVPFTIDPFNEVDSLVLSELAYVDFAGIVPGPESGERGKEGADSAMPVNKMTGISIKKAAGLFWDRHTREEIEMSGTLFKRAPFVLRKLCSGSRFENMRLAGYVNHVSAERGGQISALTCFPGDGSICVVFRGTDDTLIGWKEDLSFSFLKETDGQKSAEDYLSANFREIESPIRVMGHSKGGNFAIYASAFCSPSVRKHIQTVYAFDAPGFLQETLDRTEYRENIAKVRSYVPEESVFGLLLENGCPNTVVKSSARGIWQHDALSWKVIRNRFVEASFISERSIVTENMLESWIRGMSLAERKEFVDVVFSVLEDTGVENVSEITEDQFRVIPELLRSYREMNAEERKFLREVAGRLFLCGGKSLNEELQAGLYRQFRTWKARNEKRHRVSQKTGKESE